MKYKLYTKMFLLAALKKAKLPSNYRTLIKYEKLGIIRRPAIVVTGSIDRYYSQEEIQEVVRQVKAYKKKNAHGSGRKAHLPDTV